MDRSMIPDTPSSVLSLFDTTKEQRRHFCTSIIDAMLMGETNTLETLLQVKSMEDICKSISGDARFKEIVLQEAERHGRQFDYHNAKIQVKEAGVSYDYTQCGDSHYKALVAEKEAIDEKIKAREAYLKSLPQSGIDTVSQDGELERHTPPIKRSSTTVAVTMK